MSGELPQFIRFGRAICGDLEQAERREWWLSIESAAVRRWLRPVYSLFGIICSMWV
jgi:hypothetical protein